MAVNQPNTVTVKILEKEYQVACPPEQQGELMISAQYLNKQMRGIRETGKVIGLERIAVMAALNISYELLQASEHAEADEAAAPGEAVDHLNQKIDDAMYQLRQLEIS
jgi:cell division protein ZapA